MISKITSIKDERIIEARSLASSSGRKQAGKILLEGEQIIQWALNSNWRISHVFFSEKTAPNHSFLNAMVDNDIECYQVTEGILKKISHTKYVIPFLGVGNMKPHKSEEDAGDIVIVLNNVRDQGNIGTIIRTAKAFGIDRIIATNPDFDAFYKKTIEASRGKVFDTRFKNHTSDAETIATLKKEGYQIIATSPHAPSMQSALKLKNKPIALVIGNESEGITEDIEKQADALIQIPMSGDVESLNVGVAAGISIYELKLKMVLTMLTKFIRSTLGREVNVTGKLIQRTFDIQLKKLTPYNSTQIILMMVLKCDEKMTLEHVSRDTATYGTELDEMITPLFNEGYIQYVDQKKNEIQLTAQGEKALGELWNVVEASEKQVLDGFSEPEKKQLMTFLKKIQSNCKKILNEAP